MKRNARKPLLIFCVTLVFLACMYLMIPDPVAAEESGSSRKIWDNIMLWINFGILVFFFMKYARKPLMDLLKSARSKIRKELDEVNDKLDNAKSVVNTESEKLKDIDSHVQDLQKAILEMGEKDKERIIQEGKRTSEKMIQDAWAYAENRMAMARKAATTPPAKLKPSWRTRLGVSADWETKLRTLMEMMGSTQGIRFRISPPRAAMSRYAYRERDVPAAAAP